MRTILYVDGFNLYYRKLKRSPELKWLDLERLGQRMLSQHNQIVGIKYFTARVSSFANPDAPRKQQLYFNALKSLPNLTIHEGRFQSSQKWAQMAKPPTLKPEGSVSEPWPDVVLINHTEEKGSDVNLASHLLLDAFLDRFDVAAVISGDSDLTAPIRMVRDDLAKVVGILTPKSGIPKEMEEAASFVKRIKPNHLRDSQFPDDVVLNGSKCITRPENWTAKPTS